MDAADLPDVLREAGGAWYGRDRLWAAVPDYPASFSDGAYDLKHAWVTLDKNGDFTSGDGPPEVRAEHLRAPDQAKGSSGAYAFTEDVEFWPTVVRFPTLGCWTEVGTLGGTQVRLVLRVRE